MKITIATIQLFIAGLDTDTTVLFFCRSDFHRIYELTRKFVHALKNFVEPISLCKKRNTDYL